jgi:hypothetical protein
VEVIRSPWLQFIEPGSGREYPVGSAVPVLVQLMSNTSPVQIVDPNDQLEVTLRVLQPDGRILPDQSQILKLGPKGIFSGIVHVASPGYYLVRTLLMLRKSSGEKSQDVSEKLVHFVAVTPALPTTIPPTATSVPLTVTPMPPTPVPPTFTPQPTEVPPTPVPSPPPCSTPECQQRETMNALLTILIVLAVIGVGAYLLYWFMQPKMIGVLSTSTGDTILNGKRGKLIMGTDLKAGIPLSGEGIEPRHAEVFATGDRTSGRAAIRSLNANSPVLVNGIEVGSSGYTLENDDEIQIGSQTLKYTGAPDILTSYTEQSDIH